MGGRRGHGEGGISKRSDGRWVARVEVGYVNGKRKRKNVYGKTRKEVAEKLKVLLHQQQQGINIAPERKTVATFLDDWWTQVVVPNRRPGTQDIYKAAVRRIKPHIGHLSLQKLTTADVQAMLAALQNAGYAPSTVDRARDVLINALNVAVEWELIPRNVAARTVPPIVAPYVPRVFLPNEAQRFLVAANGDRFEAAYWLGLLGLRRGEVLGARWPELDLESGAARVEWELVPVRRDAFTNAQRAAREIIQLTDTLALMRPKSPKSRRTVYLPPTLVALLHQHRVRQLQDRLIAGSKWQDRDLVFCSSIGTPILPRNFLRARKALLKRAALPNTRFHDLRHSFVSLLAASGEVSLKVIQELAGHSDPRITQQVYTHVTEDQKREAAAIMEGLLGGASRDVA
jgi:integrase